MLIQCDACQTRHDLTPPAWVLSSGKPFRFRCSHCGQVQMLDPARLAPPPAPVPVVPNTTATPAPAEPRGGGTLVPPAPPSPSEPTPTADELPEGTPPEGAVFLKQNGQIYMVRDWATLEKWITEQRVDSHDLVSEGGVRWEPIGSHATLSPLFKASQAASGLASIPPRPPEAAKAQPAANPTPFGDATPLTGSQTPFPSNQTPFGGETPFAASLGGLGANTWRDDDTEGVPTGLPPLPTEEEPIIAAARPDPVQNLRPVQNHAAPPTLPPSKAVQTLRPVPEAPKTPDQPFSLTDDPFDPDEPAPPQVIGLTPAHPGARAASDSATPKPPGLSVPTPSSAGMIAAPPLGPDEADPHSDEHDPFKSFGSGEIDGTAEVEPGGDGPNRMPLVLLAVAIGFTAIAAVIILAVVWQLQGNTPVVAPKPPEPSLGTVIGAPKPAPAPVPAPAPTPEGTEKTDTTEAVAVAPAPVVPAPAPKPEVVAPAPEAPKPSPAPKPEAPKPSPAPKPEAPKPSPAPKPEVPKPSPAPKPTSVKALVDQGWNQADSDPDAAQKTFEKALGTNAGDTGANYGLGYVLLLKGQAPQARPYLCKALTGSDVGTQREVRGLLSRNGLSCE